jgi:hypothetical protein
MLNEIEEKVREKLIEIAQKQANITYQKLSDECKLGLDMSNPDHNNQLAHILGDISVDEHLNKRRMLSAVVFRSDTNMPGEGFFNLAKELGKLKTYAKEKDKLDFFVSELKELYAFWKK